MSDKPEFMQRAVLIEKGNRHDDFEIGQEFHHHWGRTVNAGDNSAFNTLTLHFNPMYFNEEYARRHGHERLPVNPLLVFNTVLGLSVEDLSEGIGGPFLSINNCKFHAPLYEGDTIEARSTVVGKRDTKKEGIGVVTWHTQGFNQHGDLILEYQRSNMSVKPGARLEI